MADAKRNHETAAGWAYHNATKHSFRSVRDNVYFLDWPNKPLPFKIYTTPGPIGLPREVPPLDMPALEAISKGEWVVGNGEWGAEEKPIFPTPHTPHPTPDLKTIAQILYYSAGVTKIKRHPGGEIIFRAAACTGALYEIELYLVCGDLPDLEAGVYHFSPHDFSLRRLRRGDYRGVIARATAKEPSVTSAPVTIICTGTYWRNAWKYQARTYRHFGWDNGTLLANMLAVSAASGLPAEIVLGFVDAEVNRLLDLDVRGEVSLCLVPIGRTSESSMSAPREATALGLETIPLSHHEVEYPAMLEMHDASLLESVEEVNQWRAKPSVLLSSAQTGAAVSLRPLPEEDQPKDTTEQVILRRGSTRTFDKAASITLAQLSTILDNATRGLPADFLEPPGAQLNDVYLIVHSVQGLKPGAYFFARAQSTLELLKEGGFRAEAHHLGLEQDLPADACVDIFFLA